MLKATSGRWVINIDGSDREGCVVEQLACTMENC